MTMPQWSLLPDVLADVLLYPVGGRATNVEGDYYSCPIEMPNGAFDCRMILTDGRIELGLPTKVKIKFMNRDGALESAFVGCKFKVWEGKIVGEGEILEIYHYTG